MPIPITTRIRPKYRLGTLFMSVLLVAHLSACQNKSGAQDSAASPPPPVVNVVEIKPQALELKSTLAGRVTAVHSVEIRPQVTGIVTKRLFDEGSEVEAGAQLYQIDAAPYEAALANAKGELAVAEANANAAKLKADRYTQLNKSKAVSQQDLDEAQATWLQASARIQVASAAVKTAQINLNYTAIRAPIAGTISRSSITEGALVSAQQASPLAVIRQLSPIYVDISRPASDLMAMKMQGDSASRKVTIDLENGTTHSEEGELQFSESYVDEGTGTVTSRIMFQNSDQSLLPGMFVRATVINSTLTDALLIPQRSVLRSADGTARTYLVANDNTVELREVRLGQAIGDQWLVLGGIQGGDRAIISGLQKIKAGAAVNVQVDAK